MGEENGITIGFKEIYNEQVKMAQAFLRLEMRLDNMDVSLKLAPEANERSKQNEHKIEVVSKTLNDHITKTEEQEKQRKNDKKWAIGCVLTIALFIAGLYFK